MRSGLANRPTTSGRAKFLDLRRNRDAGHQRHIAGLHAAIGEVDRRRRLRRARDADQHDVGLFEILDMLAVVVQHRVVERVDALEIFGIERVLRAHAVAGLGAEIGLQQRQHRPEDRQARHAQLAAMVFEPLHQVLLEQRVEDDAGRLLDFGQDAVELLLRAHQRIDVLDRHDLAVLRGRGPRHGRQRLAGRIRDEVQMEVAAAALWHVSPSREKTVRYLGRRPCSRGAAQASAGSEPRIFPHSGPGDARSTRSSGRQW